MRAVKRVEGRTTTDNSANGRRAALATVVVLNVGAILVGVSLVRLIGRHLVPATVGEIDERPVGDVNVGWDALWEAGVVAAYVRRRACTYARSARACGDELWDSQLVMYSENDDQFSPPWPVRVASSASEEGAGTHEGKQE